MEKFISIHQFPVPLTQREGFELTIKGRELAEASGKVKFLKAWVQVITRTSERRVSRAYCLWEAPDVESVMEVVGEARVPVEGVYPVVVLEPEKVTL